MDAAQHIFLTGFMGSGKSTLGKRLAGLLKRPFIDLDQVLVAQQGKSIAGIFEQEGEAAFRLYESSCLKSSLPAEPAVIALGGGTVCFGDNLLWIKQRGILVYLEMTPQALADRLKNSKQQRPLLKQVSPEELPQVVMQKLAERQPFYSQAHVSVNALSLTPQGLYEAIFQK